MTGIARLSTRQPGFEIDLAKLLAFENAQDERIDKIVEGILRDVRTRGDQAVLEYTNKFDHLDATLLSALEIPRKDLDRALGRLPWIFRPSCTEFSDRTARFLTTHIQWKN